jgi:hypothetical protein
MMAFGISIRFNKPFWNAKESLWDAKNALQWLNNSTVKHNKTT